VEVSTVNRIKLRLVLVVSLALLSDCGGPSVTVQNNTKFLVRAVVTSGGGSQVLSPSPGESASADVGEGVYSATVIPDTDWVEYAKLTRKVLNDRLANADNLTGDQLLDVVRRLKDIAAAMQQFEQAASSSGKCDGSVSQDGGGVVTVSTASDGSLVVSCKSG
jgi:hypothetical protein